MATSRQVLGAFGEERVVRDCSCPRCKRSRTLVRLPPNFKCADVICDFCGCGYLAQVKTSREKAIDSVPRAVLGAAWGPQRERMEAAIYFPLFLVLVEKLSRNYAIFYLSADLQNPTMFRPRSPLSATARRASWQGFMYELESVRSSFVRLR
jgi:Dam-replacing family